MTAAGLDKAAGPTVQKDVFSHKNRMLQESAGQLGFLCACRKGKALSCLIQQWLDIHGVRMKQRHPPGPGGTRGEKHWNATTSRGRLDIDQAGLVVFTIGDDS